MAYYETPGKEAAAIEEFQLLTMSEVVPKVEELLQATSQLDFDQKLDALRSSDLMRRWQTMFGTFARAHRTDNLKAASDIAEEVSSKLREAVEYKKTLSSASAPAAGGFKKPRKYSRKYCKKTPCRKMGFTQRSSCRPYKNCFTRKARRSGY
jgi:hypothetical protein